MVAVISVDAYFFFGFLRPDLLPSGYGNRFFFSCTVPPDSKETELGSSD